MLKHATRRHFGKTAPRLSISMSTEKAFRGQQQIQGTTQNYTIKKYSASHCLSNQIQCIAFESQAILRRKKIQCISL